jgi:hypothetical protein
MMDATRFINHVDRDSAYPYDNQLLLLWCTYIIEPLSYCPDRPVVGFQNTEASFFLIGWSKKSSSSHM